MKKKVVIGIIGEQAGGKGSVAKIIIKKYGGKRLTTSDILRRTLDSLHIPVSRTNLTNLALNLKNGFGQDALMKAMLREVELVGADLTIVDGIRMPGDEKPFRDEYGDDFHLLYVTADAKTRYERSTARGEKVGEADQSFEDFLEKEKAETEKYIKEVGEKADFIINNDSSADELEEKVLEIMEKI